MAKNPYFDSWNDPSEQDMYDGLIQESIEIYGETMYYCPRRRRSFDQIYTEDDQNYFDKAYSTTFYIKNVEGFEGDGNFMSKFGLEIRDQITLACSNTIFSQDVAVFENGMVRPREGDVIYFPLNDKMFEIVFVQKFSLFYPMGVAPTYDLTCQLYEYTGSQFTTGIPEIDKVNALSENVYDNALLTEDGYAFLTENGDTLLTEDYDEQSIDPMDIDVPIQREADQVLDFTETDPYSEGPF